MLSEIALNSIRGHLKENIVYARYKVGDTYHRADIQAAQIFEDGRIAVMFIIDHTVTDDIVVTEVQLCDKNDNVWASKAAKIIRREAQEGIMYRFRFSILED